MRVSDALETLSKFYVPGVAKYYGALTPDPWQQMHDDLNAAMQNEDWSLIDAAADRFVERARELVDRFKREGASSQGVSAADAVNLGSQVKKWQSRKGKYCVRCEGKENLKLVPEAPGSLEVLILCSKCLESQERKGA